MTAAPSPRGPGERTARSVRAFRAAEAFAVEAFRALRAADAPRFVTLAAELRRAVVRGGGALVAATSATPGSACERDLLEQARTALSEGRYYLFLARRLGMIDLRRYRGLAARQDAALREVGELLRKEGRSPP